MQRAQGEGREPNDGVADLARRGSQPHRVKTFKLSNDPRFDEKLVDVLGRYLDPPENAIVLCIDDTRHNHHLTTTHGISTRSSRHRGS